MSASAGLNNITIFAANDNRKKLYLFSVEIMNATSADVAAAYVLKSPSESDQVCGLIPAISLSAPVTLASAQIQYDSAVWHGKIPFNGQMQLFAVFLNSTANDDLWLKAVYGE